MKVSQLFVKTLREVPSGAEMSSHIFLLRGGYIKQFASGLYSILPLGKRVLNRIETIIRHEMEAIDSQEIDLPLVQPSEFWKESGRYQVIGEELVRLRDRGKHEMVLAMTHEEAVTDMLRETILSYKQLPKSVYQIKLKFRDEPRCRGGLIRVREFMMKDAYSFHATDEDLDAYYEQMYEAYENIFHRVGIKPVVVRSDTGIMGGKYAHEFMLESESGEDYLILSEDNSYAANREIAQFDRESKPETLLELKKIETPKAKTIEEISRFLGTEKPRHMKAVLFKWDAKLVMVLLRGDLEVSGTKVKNYLKASQLVPAEEAFIRSFGIVPGYASSIGIPENTDFLILVDESITRGNNFVGGANEEGMHYLNVNYERDFKSSHEGDFALAQTGHKEAGGARRLRATRGIEIGNIFKLGVKFSKTMKAEFLGEDGKSRPVVMGCYGIGVGRLMAAVVENSHDDFGPIWPKSIAPFSVEIVSVGMDAPVLKACEELYAELTAIGLEVLFDNRDERPGVKFKDADLWGSPLRLAISAKTLVAQGVEWKERPDKQFTLVPRAGLVEKIRDYFQSA